MKPTDVPNEISEALKQQKNEFDKLSRTERKARIDNIDIAPHPNQPGIPQMVPLSSIMELLGELEREILASGAITKRIPSSSTSINTISALRQRLEASNDSLNDIVVSAMGVGFLLGAASQNSESELVKKFEKLNPFNQTGRTKDKLPLGEKGPGRPKSNYTAAMEILAIKIEPPKSGNRYTKDEFLKQLINKYKSIKHLIKLPPKDADRLHSRKKSDKPSILISSAINYLNNIQKSKRLTT